MRIKVENLFGLKNLRIQWRMEGKKRKKFS